MKVTPLGLVTAAKNLGLFIATFTVAAVETNPAQFFYALLIYALVSVPTDLYLLNRAHESGKSG